jgi:membrane protein DedA with SNARE-associated domain
LLETILHWISIYGYAAIYALLMFGIVGLPIPDETMLVFCGYLVSRGHLKPVQTFAVALFGSISGITTSYLIGRTLGLGFVHKYGRYVHLTEGRLEYVHRWFDRIGHWLLFVGYYIAGVRHFTAILAGTSCLEFRTFAAYAWSGAAVWVSTFLAIGYYFGEHWEEVAAMIHENMLLISAVIVLLALAYALWLWKRRRRLARSSDEQR